MPRRKAKPITAAPADFTDAIQQGDGFTDARVVMMPGETKRVALHTRRRVCPAMRWGWLSEEQRAILVLFSHAADDAGYGRVRCSLAPPTGEGLGASQEKLFARRQRYAAMCNAVQSQGGLRFVQEALDPVDRESFDQTAARLIGGSRDHSRMSAMLMARDVANDLLAWRAAGERLDVARRGDAFEQWAAGLHGA